MYKQWLTLNNHSIQDIVNFLIAYEMKMNMKRETEWKINGKYSK